MKDFNLWITRFTPYAALLSLVYAVLVLENQMAKNVFYFISWVTLIIIYLTYQDKEKHLSRFRTNKVPFSLRMGIVASIVVALAAYAWFVYASVWLLILFVTGILNSEAREK